MEEAKLQTLLQNKAFLDGTSEVEFRVPKEERNQFIGRILKRFGYAPHGRVDKRVLLRYIERIIGLSRQQVTRLVRQYRKDGKLSKQPCAPKQSFTISLYRSRRAFAGRDRCAAWHAVRACHQEAYGTRSFGFW